MIIRKASLLDIPKIIDLEVSAWPEAGAASEDQFRARIETFQDGVLVAEDGDRIVGVVVGEVLPWSFFDKDSFSWSSATDNGYIRGTHDLSGDSLFGVDLTVSPDYQKKGVGRMLLNEIGKMAIRMNLRFGVLGARMPEYHKYKNKYSAEEYLRLRREDGLLVDSELRFYERNQLKLIRPVKDYFPDKDSCNYGVIAVWKNPFYVKSRMLGRVIGGLGSALFRL